MTMVKTLVKRCGWCTQDPLYISYHDHEWGRPLGDEQRLFELLILEGMQAGLSWLTVLKKRAHMKSQFFDFEIARLARAKDDHMAAWLADAGLIRHRGKLSAMLANARCVAELDTPFTELLWSFVDGQPRQNRWRQLADVPAQTTESVAMAKTLKKAGFKFVGPTTCYAFMQSAGMVNDHVLDCDAYAVCSAQGARWRL